MHYWSIKEEIFVCKHLANFSSQLSGLKSYQWPKSLTIISLNQSLGRLLCPHFGTFFVCSQSWFDFVLRGSNSTFLIERMKWKPKRLIVLWRILLTEIWNNFVIHNSNIEMKGPKIFALTTWNGGGITKASYREY